MLLSTIVGSGAAGGRTARQIEGALQLDGMENGKNAYLKATALYQNVIDSLTHEVSTVKNQTMHNVPMATAMFSNEGFEIDARVQHAIVEEFNGTVQQVDFSEEDETVRIINAWAKNQSYGRISEVITAQEIDANTVLALMNIFAFKDNWKSTFDPAQPGLFFASESESISVPMMSTTERMPFINATSMGFSAIKKPFNNPRFSFLIVLPNTPYDFEAIDRMLYNTESVRDLFARGANVHVSLTLPKFYLEHKLDLIPALERLGIRDLFDNRLANLSGITKQKQLYVSLLKQASVLRVDESGVEAVAVTYALVSLDALFDSVEFKVDHPFGCMIYDEQQDLPLLVARVVHPKTRN